MRKSINENRKIVIIRSFYPNPRMEKQAHTLANHGYGVSLIGWERVSRSGADNDDRLSRVRLLRLRVSPVSIKVAFYLPVWWLFIILQLFIARWDVVHAIDFESFVPSLIAAKIKRKRIIYDIADFFADNVQFPVLPNLTKRIIAKVDRALMKFADAILIANEPIIKHIGISTSNQPVAVINNSPDPDILHKVSARILAHEGFTVYYGGWVYKNRGISDVCLAIKDLADVQLIITGPCPQNFEVELQEVCRDIGNVTLHLGWIPHEEIVARTVSADLLFALYDPAITNNRYASPNKLFEAMMCGKPIIVSDGSVMTDIVREENCGLVVPYGDINAIREAILKLENNPELRQSLAHNGRRAYENRYSWRIMEQRLLDIYQHICNKRQIEAVP